MKSRNPDGYNVNATITFRNPSPLIVEMVSPPYIQLEEMLIKQGFVSLNLSVSGSSIGHVDIPNLHLQKGVTETTVLGDIDVGTLATEAIGNSDPSAGLGDVTIDIQGDRVVYNGQEIPYFSAAMQAVSAPVTVNLLDYAADFL